jgi:hypothetical protein
MNTLTPKEIARLAPGEQGFAQFALQVVSLLVGDGVHLTRPPREDVVRLLVRVALTGDPEALVALGVEFRRHRIPAEAAVDVYVPAAAKQIGASWHDDDIDILEATVAISRLQNLVRDLSRAWHADDAVGGAGGGAGEGSVLLVVPEGEQHSLGAIIATAQLRRHGISVSLQLAPSWPRLSEVMSTRHFDALFLSVGNRTSLEIAATFVKTMERRVRPRLPVVVGGSIPMDLDAVRRATSADFATRDVRAALDFLGLNAARHAAQ